MTKTEIKIQLESQLVFMYYHISSNRIQNALFRLSRNKRVQKEGIAIKETF